MSLLCYDTIQLGLTTAPLYSGTPFTIFIFWTLGMIGVEEGGGGKGEGRRGGKKGGKKGEERRGREEGGGKKGEGKEEDIHINGMPTPCLGKITRPGFGNVHRH